jgi:hypothetical protein
MASADDRHERVRPWPALQVPGGLPRQPRWAPVSPSVALLPGVVLLFVGLWMVTDGGPLALGWASFTVGLALMLIGAVAHGVAWGLDLHNDRRR